MSIIVTEASPLSPAASIPPELFKNILSFVGDEARLNVVSGVDPALPETVSAAYARRDEMRHLSACSLTCLYWAQLTRGRMFQFLILRSYKDLFGLQYLLRAPQSPHISPISDNLRRLYVFYTLGDHLWFHNLARLKAYHQISRLEEVSLHITGRATPAFIAASTRGSVLHPLFFAVPRVLPVMFPEKCLISLSIENIHLPNPTVLFNLLQDCLSLCPQEVQCSNLTWDLDSDSVFRATPSSVGLKYACRTKLKGDIPISGCTDDVLVAAMLKSVPHNGLSQRRQGPHLGPTDTSYLFDVMLSTWNASPTEHTRTRKFNIWSYHNFDFIQQFIAVRLPPRTDFCLDWGVDPFVFRCIASQLVQDDAGATGNGVRNITYFIIHLHYRDTEQLRRHMKTLKIDWDVFLQRTVRRFPHLRQIAIQCMNGSASSKFCLREILVEFVAHLGEAWISQGSILELHYGTWMWAKGKYDWAQVQLDTLIDEIRRKREEIKSKSDSEKAISSELESSVIAEEGSAHNG